MSARLQEAGTAGSEPAYEPIAARPGREATSFTREIVAGATVGLISLPLCVTAGALAYTPLGRDFVGLGAAAGILSAVAGGLAAGLARSSSFIPNTPSVSMALIQATFLGLLLEKIGGDTSAVLALMPLTILGAGLTQVVIGALGLARVVKFTPYPVLAGFVTGIAILTFVRQVPALFNEPSLGALAGSLMSGHLAASPAMPIVGLVVIVVVRLSERLAPRLPGMLVALAWGTFSWHVFKAIWPDIALGDTIGAVDVSRAPLGLHVDLDALRILLFEPVVLHSLLATSLTIGALGTIDYTFAFRSAQRFADLTPAPRRDIAGQGVSNAVAALSGAVPLTASLAFATTSYEAGGRTRLSTAATAVVLLLAALVAPRLIAAMPVVVLSAMLVAIAIRMWDRWCVAVARDVLFAGDREARTRAQRNALILLAVMASTVIWQPIVGALVGVVVSCLVFIAEMSRPIIRRELDGTQVSSKRIRSRQDRTVLAAHSASTRILQLQGVLFFGNADDLATRIQAQEHGAEIVILDLRRVTDVDTSGATVLRQIAQRCRDRDIRFLISGASATYGPLLDGVLAGGSALLPDLDAALELAEEAQLAKRSDARATWAALNLEQTDLAGGLSAQEVARLRARLVAVSYVAGDALCRAGEPADKLWLITRGSVSVRLDPTHGGKRVAGLGPGTSVGELGLLDRQPRSADVVADCEVDALMLSAADFDALLREEPALGQSLLSTIARLTAQRLRATSDELRLAEM